MTKGAQIMLQLTPKARRLVDYAIQRTENPDSTRVWSDWSASHPDKDTRTRSFPELTPEAAQVVLTALRDLNAWLESEIQSGHRHEDELADMDNDLSFSEAIEHDLARELGGKSLARTGKP